MSRPSGSEIVALKEQMQVTAAMSADSDRHKNFTKAAQTNLFQHYR